MGFLGFTGFSALIGSFSWLHASVGTSEPRRCWMYVFLILEWRPGGKWLAPRRVADSLGAMKALALQLAQIPGVESFYVFGPEGVIRPEDLRRLTGVTGC